MTNQEYYKKNLNSSNVIMWICRDGLTFTELQDIEALTELDFVNFQNARVIQTRVLDGFDMVYLDLENLRIKGAKNNDKLYL